MLTSDLIANTSDEEILERIRVGGRDFVWEKDVFGCTSLHIACQFNASIDVVKELIEVGGGQDYVWEKDRFGYTALHWACTGNDSVGVVKELIKVGGGRGIVWEKDRNGSTALHVACARNASIDVVKELIEVGGGRDFICEKDEYGRTSLHVACINNASIDVVKALIEAGGGRDYVWEKDEDGWTALHHHTCTYDASIDLMNLLIEYGGVDLITQVGNEGNTALDGLITKFWGHNEEQKKAKIEITSFLLNKGVELQIGGEYSIGGLFTRSTNQEEIKGKIYENWHERLLPALELVMAQPNNQHLPILQALIVNEAPPRIIKSTLDTFSASINTTDSFGKYPIDIAVEYGLSWDDGLEQIVESFALVQQTTPLNICTKHGVRWENGTKIVLENDDNVDIILETADTSTCLFPFMVAAVGRCGNKSNHGYDFDSIFQLIKSRPLVVRQIGEEKQLLGKRKRSS